MSQAIYKNHEHYIKEGWCKEPKESFKAFKDILAPRMNFNSLSVLDVGCATGELLNFLAGEIECPTLVGVDVAPELLDVGRRLLPSARFENASALNLTATLKTQFDLVCAFGCMSIFDETQIEPFWDNVLGVTKPGGYAVVFAPLNEFGVDTMIRHRKRMDDKIGVWETGWNIFSHETIREVIEARGASVEFVHFELPLRLDQNVDPVRTWTLATENRDLQLVNGLKLLIDHYFIVVRPCSTKI